MNLPKCLEILLNKSTWAYVTEALVRQIPGLSVS